ncbi:MAG: aminotransferase class III-fold pyridoxal phosphate-dependent enzyme [Pseudomonadota bacterium]
MSTSSDSFWQVQLKTLYPDSGTLTQLDGELDLNFCDAHAVYKVMREDCDAALVDMQCAVLTHLAGTAVPVSAIVLTATGKHFDTITDENGDDRLVWAQRRLPGMPAQRISPISDAMLERIGQHVAQLHDALATFDHAALDRRFEWHPLQATGVFKSAQSLHIHTDGELIARIAHDIATPAVAQLQTLPQQALHNDLNDCNLLALPQANATATWSGVIDFGDTCRGPVISDVANVCAYFMINAARPFDAMAAIVRGYGASQTLSRAEAQLLWPLILSRLCVSAIVAHNAVVSGRDDPYLQISQAALLDFLRTHADTDPARVLQQICMAAGVDNGSADVLQWIAAQRDSVHPIFGLPLDDAPILDLSVCGDDSTDDPLQPDMADIERAVQRLQGGDPTRPVLGCYGEPRLIYGAPFFWQDAHPASDRRTVHIAIDVFLPTGTDVRAPLDAQVHSAQVCDAQFDYGGLIVLRHETTAGDHFFTLYGHLTHASAAALRVGQPIAAGEVFAQLGAPQENGGWPPHVHFQLGLTDRPGSEWPGVVDPDEWSFMRHVFPDPAPLLGLPDAHATPPATDVGVLEAQRQQHAPANLKTSYQTPLTIARGWRSLLFDLDGRTYLDAYNNVPHVGHAHPQVRRAIDRQLRLVNTNSRYLQPIHGDYMAKLAALLPDPLDMCFLVNSGSEANELALRLARAHTGRKETLALRDGYHGHTVATIDISHYKFAGPGGAGKTDWVHLIDNPDVFRGKHRGIDAGDRYAQDVQTLVDTLVANGTPPGMLIAETFPSVGGQIVPPAGYLQGVYAAVRAAGGLCIADEVQTGLGRLGKYFWGFEQQQVTPDIVVIGKPIGNGYPLAAVVTTKEIAASFDTGMEFFATFGGSSVSCAAGIAVLDIIEQEQLSERASIVGAHLLQGLSELATRFPLLADVRGLGLFIGVEIADAARNPLPAETSYIVERLRERRILIGSDGPDHNVLKIRPPLVFSEQDADYLLAALGDVLNESALAQWH